MTLCFHKLYIHLLKVYILSQAIWREQILSPHKSQYYFCYAYFSSWRKLQIAPDYQKTLHHAGFDSVRDKFENLFRKQVLYHCPTFTARLFLPSFLSCQNAEQPQFCAPLDALAAREALSSRTVNL